MTTSESIYDLLHVLLPIRLTLLEYLQPTRKPAGSGEQLTTALIEAVAVEYIILDKDEVEVARGVVGGSAITVPAGIYSVRVLSREPLELDDMTVRGEQLTLLEIAEDSTLHIQ